MSSASFLRNVPVLADLSAELLEELSREATPVRVAAGEWILREGDPADSLYILRSGRVEVVDERPPETLIRVLRRGDVLGELALLRRAPRSASARARRDTELLELTRAAFESLIQAAPDFALALVRSIGAQLAASRSPVAQANPPRTIAVVGLDAGAPWAKLTAELETALAAHGTVASLSGGELNAIDQAVESVDRVTLAAGHRPHDEWTDLCLREADLILAVTTGHPEPGWLQRATALRGCELLVLAPAVAAPVLESFQPREVQVVAEPSRRRPALAALARRLTGRSLGVVLSGGGARAFAHLGVLDELRASGLTIDRIGGVSLGSLVAATIACEWTTDHLHAAMQRGFVTGNPTNDYAPPLFSIIRGAKVRRLLEEEFGERRIEALPLRYFSVSCDLVGRESIVHRTGPLADAIYASLAIPGVFPPVATEDGRLLVDGGVLDNLPVGTMARTGEGPVIAVDVAARVGSVPETGRPLVDRVDRRIRRALTGSEAYIPRFGETIVRTVMAGSSDTIAAARLHADLVIAPEVEGIGLMDWKAIEHAREIGRRAARAALESAGGLPIRLAA